jgi:hypothetical protein
MLMILRQDLQRTGSLPGEDTYLLHLLQAARASLERQGARQTAGEDWYQTVIATAAWMYRKRITGEAEPQYLRRMRLDLIVSQQARGNTNAP